MAKKQETPELPHDHIVCDDPKQKFIWFKDGVRYERTYPLPDGRWVFKKSE
jgi:hypothetical protein